ncbi:hypothetical protein [Leisingera sp. XS_AS12]|uniref:hypothetical protein n=1 Tax=Leisingera sp. XS_AS12 TaxID=3241294 RepID=UPI003513F7CF
MSDRRSSMLATLRSLRSVRNPTPNQLAAAANIEAGLSKMSEYAARAPKGGRNIRAITFIEREHLMQVADDQQRSDAERARARSILTGDDLTTGDLEFINRTSGKGDR